MEILRIIVIFLGIIGYTWVIFRCIKKYFWPDYIAFAKALLESDLPSSAKHEKPADHKDKTANNTPDINKRFLKN